MNRIRDAIKKNKCEEVVPILKTLAHSQRLLILCFLAESEKTVSQLEELCEASQPSISQHLTRMKLQGLVSSERKSNFVYYTISNQKVFKLLESLANIFHS